MQEYNFCWRSTLSGAVAVREFCMQNRFLDCSKTGQSALLMMAAKKVCGQLSLLPLILNSVNSFQFFVSLLPCCKATGCIQSVDPVSGGVQLFAGVRMNVVQLVKCILFQHFVLILAVLLP